MPISFRTLGPDEPFVVAALDEQRIPRKRTVADRLGRKLTVFWVADPDGNVTEIIEDSRNLMRNILSK